MKRFTNKIIALLCGVLSVLCIACKANPVSSSSFYSDEDDDVLRIFDQIPSGIRISSGATGKTFTFAEQTQYSYLFETLYTELHRQISEENVIAQPKDVEEICQLEVIGKTRQTLYTVSVSDTRIALNDVQYSQGALMNTVLNCYAAAQMESLLITDPHGMMVQYPANMHSDRLFYPLMRAVAQSGGQIDIAVVEQPNAYYDLEIVTEDKVCKKLRVTPNAVLAGNDALENMAAYTVADRLFGEKIVYPTV